MRVFLILLLAALLTAPLVVAQGYRQDSEAYAGTGLSRYHSPAYYMRNCDDNANLGAACFHVRPGETRLDVHLLDGAPWSVVGTVNFHEANWGVIRSASVTFCDGKLDIPIPSNARYAYVFPQPTVLHPGCDPSVSGPTMGGVAQLRFY